MNGEPSFGGMGCLLVFGVLALVVPIVLYAFAEDADWTPW